MTRAVAIALPCLLAMSLSACKAAGLGWDEVDYCPEDGCTACDSDDDCVSGTSCCSETMYCLHRDDGFAVCDLGCREPDPPPCACDDGRCRFE